MATWRDDVIDVLNELGGTGTISEIRAGIARRRSPLPATWTNMIANVFRDHSSDSVGYRGGTDVFFSVQGLGQGVWGLREAVPSTPEANDLRGGSVDPKRAAQTTYRVLRDTAMARQVKLLHRDCCQLCGEALRIGRTRTYSEGHHIIPLGGAHAGPDTPANIIVLCPNHHALCDYGAITLDLATITHIPGHSISSESITYHNENIAGKRFGLSRPT